MEVPLSFFINTQQYCGKMILSLAVDKQHSQICLWLRQDSTRRSRTSRENKVNCCLFSTHMSVGHNPQSDQLGSCTSSCSKSSLHLTLHKSVVLSKLVAKLRYAEKSDHLFCSRGIGGIYKIINIRPHPVGSKEWTAAPRVHSARQLLADLHA